MERKIDVKTAANLTMQLLYVKKDVIHAGLIVAGWDKATCGSIWALPIGGSIIKVPFTVGGSGSAYILGFCDHNWRPGMSENDCKKFVLRAISLAIARDSSSGGCIRIVTINKEGT